MTSFIVETYAPHDDTAPGRALTQAWLVAAALAATGVNLRHVRSYVVVGDEQCFHVFEAESSDDLARAASLAGIDIERIVEAVDLERAPDSEHY